MSSSPEADNAESSSPADEKRRGRLFRRKGSEDTESGTPKKKMSFWKELPILIGVALVLVFVIQQFLARVYVIPSGSMEETLHGCPGCTGDRILVEKVSYYFTDPAPGDVVVFKGPEAWTQNDFQADPPSNWFVGIMQKAGSVIGLAPPDEKDFVKRVIAVGGQTVQCCDDQGRVLVDGKPLTEPYVYWEGGAPDGSQQFDPVRIPEGKLWVMGDNRNNSSDSRRQGTGGVTGAISVDDVIGKAQIIVLPPSRWGGISDPNPQTLAAPAWQQGLPIGVGLAAAWPVLWTGRRIRRAVTDRWQARNPDRE